MQVDPHPLLSRVLALPSVPYTEKNRRLPDHPGLYFAIVDDSELMYIGMSRKSIRQRWKTWHSAVVYIDRYGVDKDRVRIAYVLYRDIERLKADEKAAIGAFLPLLNFKDAPGASERHGQRMAEACKVIDCDEHNHSKWPPLNPPTETRPCICAVHRHADRDAAPDRPA